VPDHWCTFARKGGPRGENLTNWVTEVHPTVWRKLTNSRRVYLQLESFKVENYVRLTKCFKCQRFSHIAANCESEQSCGVCTSSEDETKSCPKANSPNDHRCQNCVLAKFRDVNHTIKAASSTIGNWRSI
jgi:hypothetical protein